MVAARSVIHLNELITHSDGTQQVKMRIVSDFWRYGPSTFSVKRNCLYSSISPKTFGSTTFGDNIRNITKMGQERLIQLCEIQLIAEYFVRLNRDHEYTPPIPICPYPHR